MNEQPVVIIDVYECIECHMWVDELDELHVCETCTLKRIATVFKSDDPRYDYSVCKTCGERWQNIDFNCALHLLCCARPEKL